MTFKVNLPLTFLSHARTSTWYLLLTVPSTARNSSNINRGVSRVQARSDITLKILLLPYRGKKETINHQNHFSHTRKNNCLVCLHDVPHWSFYFLKRKFGDFSKSFPASFLESILSTTAECIYYYYYYYYHLLFHLPLSSFDKLEVPTKFEIRLSCRALRRSNFSDFQKSFPVMNIKWTNGSPPFLSLLTTDSSAVWGYLLSQLSSFLTLQAQLLQFPSSKNYGGRPVPIWHEQEIRGIFVRRKARFLEAKSFGSYFIWVFSRFLSALHTRTTGGWNWKETSERAQLQMIRVGV